MRRMGFWGADDSTVPQMFMFGFVTYLISELQAKCYNTQFGGNHANG